MISMDLDVRNIELKKLLKEINYLLIVYTAVNNLYIEKTNGIFSIFKKIDFNELKENALSVSKLISNAIERIEKYDSTYSDTLSPIQKECTTTLLEYSNALRKTVDWLTLMFSKLHEKRNGNKLTWNENMQNNANYNKSIEEYKKIGERLNKCFSKIQ